MSKSTITIERLEEIRDCCWMDDLGLSMCELSELASMALSAMDGEPVAENIRIADALEGLLWPNMAIGNKAVIQAAIEALRAYHAQPAPVVPNDVLDALQKVARIRLDMNDFDGDRRGIADCLGDAEEALIEVVNRRAAMLAAAPQSPGSEPATVPGKWIPVSERMPEEDTDVIVYCSDTEEQFVAYHNCNGYFHYATYEKKGEGYVDIVCNPTHWMPLPAAPHEVK